MNDLSDEARRLIATAADTDGPSDARLDAIGADLFRKLGTGAAALSVVKLAGAARAVPAVKSSLAAYFLIGVTAGTGVAVTPAAIGHFYAHPRPAKQVTALAAEPPRASGAASEASSASAPGSSADEAERVSPPAVPPRVAPLPAASSPAASPPAAKVEPAPAGRRESNLSLEVASLREIQAFLAAGNGASALAASDRYFAEPRTGTLRGEHLAVRVLALCLIGDLVRARAAARLFIATSAASPLMPRLARSCVADVIGEHAE